MKQTNKTKMLTKMYLDWWNDFLTLQCSADHYGITKQKANWAIKWIENKDEDFGTGIVAFAIIANYDR